MRLSAPRRFGKTSLLRRVLADADRIGLVAVEVDFYGVLSLADVALRIEEAYGKLRGAAQRAAIAVIRTLRPRASLGAGPARIEASPTLEEDVSRRLAALLDLPLALYERRGQRVLVAFDEFQALLSVHPELDGLFRTHLQRHGDAASYIFAGSHPGLMQELFGRRERPFFGQARAIELFPLDDADLADYIGDRFESASRDPGDALAPLLDLAAGHPQRAMLLAHHLFERIPRGERGDAERWQAALAAVMEEAAESLQATWDAMESRERSVVAALAAGDQSLFARATLERFNMTKSGAQHARDQLVRAGDLRKADGAAFLVDPLLGEWVRSWHRP